MTAIVPSGSGELVWSVPFGADASETGAPDLERQDRLLFAELLTPCQPALYHFVRRSLNYAEDSADVFQETVVRALQYFSGYDRSRPFKTWLFAIACNEVRKHFGRRLTVPLDDLTSPPTVLPPRDQEDDRVEVVYRLAASLKPKARQVFFLYYGEDFPVAEVARLTGLREGNVKFILHRARKAIQKMLGELP